MQHNIQHQRRNHIGIFHGWSYQISLDHLIGLEWATLEKGYSIVRHQWSPLAAAQWGPVAQCWHAPGNSLNHGYGGHLTCRAKGKQLFSVFCTT